MSESKPQRIGLLGLLEVSKVQFVIPVYQRNYTWSADDQVRQYLIDLENVLKGKHNNHFLGIVIYLEKSLDISSREFSVIDGQQRLTTTFLIIYAIKQIFAQNGNTEKVSYIEKQYLTNHCSDDNIKYKLKPLVSDDDVYRCIVEDRLTDIKDNNSNVLKNYNYISSKLKQFIAAGYDASQILTAMDKLYVVCVPISEYDNAQKIFESFNATGAKLTASDLIRNFLLMDLGSSTQEKYYVSYWKRIEENVSADSKILEMFFRMFIALKSYKLVAKKSVYREFVSWKEQSGLDIKYIFAELLEYSKSYSFLFKSDLKKLDKKLQSALIDYRKIQSDLPMSAILEFCRLKNDGKISEETLGELIAAINGYLIRRSICDINSQNISKLFPSLLKKIIEKCAGDYTNVVKILNQEMVGNNALTSGSYMPTDKQMHELLHTANVYKRPALRIIFDRMELDNNPAPVDLSALSVEHLMPQTPTLEWIAELNTDLETYQNNLHRIGNLTLATKPDNSKMGNALWDYKNEVLKETGHLTMNMQLLQVEKWDLQCIEKRSKELIDKICELYPYPEDVNDDADALELAVTAVGVPLEVVKKGSAYRSFDNKNGYIFTASKMYPQGVKEKYWYGYNDKKFDQLLDCENLNLILICRHKNVVVVNLPKVFLESIKERLNTSLDEDGNIRHYHIVIFINPNNTVSMLLSKPTLEEIDISNYVIRGI